MIVLDVKCGNGAFMKEFDAAKSLAQLMVQIGKDAKTNRCRDYGHECPAGSGGGQRH